MRVLLKASIVALVGYTIRQQLNPGARWTVRVAPQRIDSDGRRHLLIEFVSPVEGA